MRMINSGSNKSRQFYECMPSVCRGYAALNERKELEIVLDEVDCTSACRGFAEFVTASI